MATVVPLFVLLGAPLRQPGPRPSRRTGQELVTAPSATAAALSQNGWPAIAARQASAAAAAAEIIDQQGRDEQAVEVPGNEVPL